MRASGAIGRILALLFALCPLSVLAQAGDITGAVLSVESGDTLRMQLDKLPIKVRLHGVESGNLAHAKQYVTARLTGKRVRVQVLGTNKNAVFYGDVFVAGQTESLNQELVRIGLAKWSERYAPTRTDLMQRELDAQAQKAGIWGDPTGKNVPLPAVATPPPAKPLDFPSLSTTPAPETRTVPAPPPAEPFPMVPLVAFGIGTTGGVLGWQWWRRRNLTPPPITPLSDATDGQITVQGVARLPAGEEPLRTLTAGIACLYCHEVGELYTGAVDGKLRWQTVRDEQERVGFVIEDSSGKVQVQVGGATYAELLRLLFYNDREVPQFFPNPYSNDNRTTVMYLPVNAVVEVTGEYQSGVLHAQRIRIHPER